MPSVGVGGQQARNFMGTYGYNDWELKLGGDCIGGDSGTSCWGRSLGLIGTPELGTMR